MKRYSPLPLRKYAVICAVMLFSCVSAVAGDATQHPLFVQVGDSTSSPSGWIQFCYDYVSECATKPGPTNSAKGIHDQEVKKVHAVYPREKSGEDPKEGDKSTEENDLAAVPEK